MLMLAYNKELLEEREVHTSVMTMLYETRMIAEIMILAMLHYKQTSLAQHIALKYHIRQFRDFFQDIWRIGKNKIKLLPALT